MDRDARRGRLVIKAIVGLVDVDELNRGARRAGEKVHPVPGVGGGAVRRQGDRLGGRAVRHERASDPELAAAGVEPRAHDVGGGEGERDPGVDRQRDAVPHGEIASHGVGRTSRGEGGVGPERAVEPGGGVGDVGQRPEIGGDVTGEARGRVGLQTQVARRADVERVGRDGPHAGGHAGVVRRVTPHVGVSDVDGGAPAAGVAVDAGALVGDVGVLDVDRRGESAVRLDVDAVVRVGVDRRVEDVQRRVGGAGRGDVDTQVGAVLDDGVAERAAGVAGVVHAGAVAADDDVRERRRPGVDVDTVARDLERRAGDGDDVAGRLAIEGVDSVFNVGPADAHHGRCRVGDDAVPRAGGRPGLALEHGRVCRRAVDRERAFDRELDPGGVEPGRLAVGAGELHHRASVDDQESAGGNGDVPLDDVGAPRGGPRLVDDVTAGDRRRTRERWAQQEDE